MKVAETTGLMVNALDVMNRAMQENRDSFLFNQMYSLSEKLLEGSRIGIAVYEGDPDMPHDYYTVTWQDGQLELLSHGNDESEIAWKVPEFFLNEIVENADDYIEHPWKLDWDWLRRRLSISG